jgi:hypothetical protein
MKDFLSAVCGIAIISRDKHMAHFVFLTEDISGKRAMDILIPKLLGDEITYKVYSYKGIGRIPSGMRPKTDASKRILLDQLPKVLNGYGSVPNSGTIVVICDLDDKNKADFLFQLEGMLDGCRHKPEKVLFCVAVEEFEAWYLGDLDAIKSAYPKAKDNILRNYTNDSICDTWELLADAIHDGGHKNLKKRGWQAIGEEKSVWASKISPYMDVEKNMSPSFIEMRDKLRDVHE